MFYVEDIVVVDFTMKMMCSDKEHTNLELCYFCSERKVQPTADVIKKKNHELHDLKHMQNAIPIK